MTFRVLAVSAQQNTSAALRSAETETTATEPDSPGDPQPVASTSKAEGGWAEVGSASLEKEVIQPAVAPVASPSNVRWRTSASLGSSPASRKDDSGEFGLGRIQLTFRYSSTRQQLMVVVHSVVNLKTVEGDSQGLADPYVTLYLLPDRDSKAKRKTDVIKKDLNPIFDVQFEYAVSASELRSRSLEVAVKNETGVFSTSQKVLGMALVDLSSVTGSRAVTQWFDLAPQDALKACTLKYSK